jgi:hypothetical protein
MTTTSTISLKDILPYEAATYEVTWYASSGRELRWGTQSDNDFEFALELMAALDANFDLLIVDLEGHEHHYDCPPGKADWPLNIRLGREILAGPPLKTAHQPAADDRPLTPEQIETLDRQFDDWRRNLPNA